MFVRKRTRARLGYGSGDRWKGRVIAYYQVLESIRVDGRPSHRVMPLGWIRVWRRPCQSRRGLDRVSTRCQTASWNAACATGQRSEAREYHRELSASSAPRSRPACGPCGAGDWRDPAAAALGNRRHGPASRCAVALPPASASTMLAWRAVAWTTARRRRGCP